MVNSSYWDQLTFEFSDHQEQHLTNQHREKLRDIFDMAPKVISKLKEGPKHMAELYDEMFPHWRDQKERNTINRTIWYLLGDLHLLVWLNDGRYALREDLGNE